ncbi:unnamed protein product [Clonostachys rosea]|uniref:Uncharacterized protein n=1 Tax=Bionectria ochroleuca TaxID=29856 RepID=A0ABY6U5M5_BIOOC|nr:unnamed protein product [Clonostachys rosea]
MEYTQSRQIWVMTQEYELVHDPIHECIIPALSGRWEEEKKLFGHTHRIEQATLKDGSVLFGIAYELLSHRCVTIRRDFFHGILGILKTDLEESALSQDFNQAMQQVAVSCLKKGDFSPLLMIPATAQEELDERDLRSTGYMDICSWGIGEERSPAKFPNIELSSGSPVIQVECIGTVKSIWRLLPEELSHERNLTVLLRLVLEITGPKPEDFQTAVAVRLLGQEIEKVRERMLKENRTEKLIQLLRRLEDTSRGGELEHGVASEIGETLGLTDLSLGGGHHRVVESPIGFMFSHGGTMHLSETGVMVVVNCMHCHQPFPIRAGLLKPASSLIGVKAYRIPGLRYRFTHQGGAGFLLQDGKMVGRFIWGIPTCSCPRIEQVKVNLDDLPLPKPNTYNYGTDDGREWIPMDIEKRLKVNVWTGGQTHAS